MQLATFHCIVHIHLNSFARGAILNLLEEVTEAYKWISLLCTFREGFKNPSHGKSQKDFDVTYLRRDFDVTYLRRAHKAGLIRGTCRQLGISGIKEVISTKGEMMMAMLVIEMDIMAFGSRHQS